MRTEGIGSQGAERAGTSRGDRYGRPSWREPSGEGGGRVYGKGTPRREATPVALDAFAVGEASGGA